MLKIALPNKGSLSEGAIQLMNEAGYKCRRISRELTVRDSGNNVEFIFLRPRDIAVYVGNGLLDLGITGRDLAFDSQANVYELQSLHFGKSSFYYAVPKDKLVLPDQFDQFRIATSYPNIVKEDMKKRGMKVTIVKLDGAVEISIRLGVADAIADVVESGRTLEEAGLTTVGEPIMQSEAVLIAHDQKLVDRKDVQLLTDRIKGILVARTYAMVEYDIPKESLKEACSITPGIESPTVAPLNKPDWFAVKSMITRRQINSIMDQLSEIGAKGIIVTDIRTCRI